MPNQTNFRSDVTNNREIRYTASRIISAGDEFILLEEVPASFAYDVDDVIEVHFYSIPENDLILSTTVSISEGLLKSHIVSYSDDTFKNYIRIDFTKLFVDKNLVLAPNDYKIVLNFFSNEIGAYDNRILSLQVISDSRTEAQLVFNNTADEVIADQNSKLLKEFVEPSLNKPDAVGAAEKIFTSGVTNEDPTEGLTSEFVLLAADQTELNRITDLNLYDIFGSQLNNFLLELFTFIREEIIIKGDERIQKDEFENIIRETVTSKIAEFGRIVDTRIKVQ